jgi:hypothetical protein
VLGPEELPRHLGPNPSPVRCRNLGIVRPTVHRVQIGDPLGHLDLERRRLIEVFERRPEPHHVLQVPQSDVGSVQLLQPGLGQWVHAAAEQGPHLLRGHRITGAQTVDPIHAGTDPRPRRFAAFGVIRR